MITKKLCKICGGKHHAKGLCSKCYNQLPEIKERTRKWKQNPEYKAKQKEYRETPEVKTRFKEYRNSPEVKAKDKERKQSSEYKLWKKEYNQRPDVISRRIELNQRPIVKIKQKRWSEQLENKIKIKKRMKVYNQQPKRKEFSEKYRKEYRQTHKKERNEKIKQRRQEDPNFKVIGNYRSLIRQSLIKRGCNKKNKTTELLGTTIPKAIKYLEAQFKDDMSWENYGRDGWHIDHFVPINAFDLKYIEHQKICFHYTNLQPLWEKDNIKKSDMIPLGWDENVL